MRELTTSVLLVLVLAGLGFIGLDRLAPGETNPVGAAPVEASGQRAASLPTAQAADEVRIRVLDAPGERLAMRYDPARWYLLDYMPLATLQHQTIPACLLEIEYNGESIHVNGQWLQTQRAIGTHLTTVGALTPDGSAFPRQVVYMTRDGNAYPVFTLTIGAEIYSAEQFRACQADAEAVLATEYRPE